MHVSVQTTRAKGESGGGGSASSFSCRAYYTVSAFLRFLFFTNYTSTKSGDQTARDPPDSFFDICIYTTRETEEEEKGETMFEVA